MVLKNKKKHRKFLTILVGIRKLLPVHITAIPGFTCTVDRLQALDKENFEALSVYVDVVKKLYARISPYQGF